MSGVEVCCAVSVPVYPKAFSGFQRSVSASEGMVLLQHTANFTIVCRHICGNGFGEDPRISGQNSVCLLPYSV